jgi:hypothetical protein
MTSTHRCLPFALITAAVIVVVLISPATAPARTHGLVVAAGEWYLPEGSTDWGFSTSITIENAESQPNTVIVTYCLESGPVVQPEIVLPGTSQTTINPAEAIGHQDFSTQVRTSDARAGGVYGIACDRTMTWTGPGAASPEAHSSIAYTLPYYEVQPAPSSNTWYLPDGSAKWGFETWLLLQNVSNQPQDAKITYMIEGEGARTVHETVPPSTRRTFSMKDHIGEEDASIKVEGTGIYAERSMYRQNRREGADSIGTDTPASDYYLAEGSTAWGFSTFVLIQNPNPATASITLTYMTDTGPVRQPAFNLPGESRETVRVSDFLPNRDFSVLVHGNLPVIAERSMFWNSRTGEACHASIGVNASFTAMYLPDGQTSGGYETFILVQNPNGEPASVMVYFYNAYGGPTETLSATIAPWSRKTFNMKSAVTNGRASTAVSADRGIIAERSMYWYDRGAGAETVGAWPREIR